MIIGIDTSSNKSYSCLIFSYKDELNKLYYKIDKELNKKCNWKTPLHWRKMSNRTRKCVFSICFEKIRDSRIQVFIFNHKKPINTNAKHYYLNKLPNEFAFGLEKLLRKTFGSLNIECDEDFEVKNTTDSSKVFLKNLIKCITFRLIGEKIPVIESNAVIYSDIKRQNKTLRITGSVTKDDYSKAIQISDLILGMYLFDFAKMNKLSNIKFIRIRE